MTAALFNATNAAVQNSRISDEDLKIAISGVFGNRAKTKHIVEELRCKGIKVTHNRVNAALGRFTIAERGKVSRLTPHYAALISAVREVTPLLYTDLFLLTCMGNCDTVKQAVVKVGKVVKVYA